MPTNIQAFEQRIGVTFSNKELLKQAFIHRSYINENPHTDLKHNERLEFLGDAVLELVVTDYLFYTYANEPEGKLTAYRSALVNTVVISEAARDLGMNEFLLLSRGEARDTGKAREYILANTFESFIGALYLDQGYEAARAFITDALIPRLEGIIEQGLWRDPKSFVQEKAQEVYGATPVYQVLDESGPDHDKEFTIGIYFNDSLIAQGTGSSKQEAQQAAAQAALKHEGWNE